MQSIFYFKSFHPIWNFSIELSRYWNLEKLKLDCIFTGHMGFDQTSQGSDTYIIAIILNLSL